LPCSCRHWPIKHKLRTGEDYRQLARIPLLKDADSVGYDISRHYLYVDNAGQKIYAPRIEDGEFYNMKMPVFEAEGKRIGILAMEIASTDAVSEEAAAHKAVTTREEVAKKIPSLDSLLVTTAGD
jgi:hypothetical protein